MNGADNQQGAPHGFESDVARRNFLNGLAATHS